MKNRKIETLDNLTELLKIGVEYNLILAQGMCQHENPLTKRIGENALLKAEILGDVLKYINGDQAYLKIDCNV